MKKEIRDAEFKNFFNWLDLNLEALTWQGKNFKIFDNFWKLFFIDGLSLVQVSSRFRYVIGEVQTGPLNAWFKWLFKKFVCYIYITKDISIFQLSKDSNFHVSEVALILRYFFLEKCSHKEDYINELFQIGNIGDKNIHLTYKDIKGELLEENKKKKVQDIMTSMEVTLYPEFLQIYEKIQKHFSINEKSIISLKEKTFTKEKMKFFRDLFFLCSVGVFFIFLIKEGNRFYEDYLIDKINVYEFQLKWLDKTLSFKEKNKLGEEVLNVKSLDINETGVLDKLQINDEEERFGTESEVILTSWGSLPKDFDIADYEKSEYEEIAKRGYRDSKYGYTKVYRVMMNSVDILSSKEKLNTLLQTYKVEQVDNVKPGTFVPGGVYYNIYVARPYLKEFLARLGEIGKIILYESKTRTRRNPIGKTKVFIWIKSLD